MGSMLAVLIGAIVLVAGRLMLFCFTIFAYLRWQVPVATLERLLRAPSISRYQNAGPDQPGDLTPGRDSSDDL